MDPRRLLPGLLAVAVVCLVTTLGVVALRPGADSSGAQALTSTTPASARSVPPGVSGPAADILRAWDRRRGRAWARGDADALAGLYLAGSRAGAADVAALRRWTSRGLRVVGLQTQVLEVAVAAETGRRVRLVVTDRLVGGEAVGGSGARVPLPTDRASTRVITLERVDGRWLVDEVRAR